jgi:hypothetical protein
MDEESNAFLTEIHETEEDGLLRDSIAVNQNENGEFNERNHRSVADDKKLKLSQIIAPFKIPPLQTEEMKPITPRPNTTRGLEGRRDLCLSTRKISPSIENSDNAVMFDHVLNM